ncbi:MAG: aminomethyl-transferring glycine dehydrogenase [Gammaproteobacteria bacterium]|nr:aminomethyl-transferring glycine dehydrogenase [Gammaproteobacteria bacterium]
MQNIFADRHIGISELEESSMLKVLDASSRKDWIQRLIPQDIQRDQELKLPKAATEAEALAELRVIAAQNKVFKCYLGQGYYPNFTPSVILRNILENPAWYTAYTPYQAEISQGRLEALLNFQTMVGDLTAMPIANASMLDESTSVAEAITLAKRCSTTASSKVYVDRACFPQTIEVIKTRCNPLGIEIELVPITELLLKTDGFAGVIQYPNVYGEVYDLATILASMQKNKLLSVVACDLLALSLLIPPGEVGADFVAGSSQRLGLPMGCGGPHAGFLACKDEFKRSLPGRLVGISVDADKNKAYRLALQTREQHIRREKATSNICTAQVLPAVVSSMYAVYHGPEGLHYIASKIADLTAKLKYQLASEGYQFVNETFFDTLTVICSDDNPQHAIYQRAIASKALLKKIDTDKISITLNETTNEQDIGDIYHWITQKICHPSAWKYSLDHTFYLAKLLRKSSYLQAKVFHSHRSETEMLRYIRSLSDKDLALDRCMIPLGSCTMKLNATSEMLPISWPEFADIHPYSPQEHRLGYQILSDQLISWLKSITGYTAISLQPNAGSQGEYAGLLAIKAYFESHGASHRNVCLIPSSAHGTNPASAQMVGMKIVMVAVDKNGNVDIEDLREKCRLHNQNLATLMITYPSTHGVFETQIREICDTVHAHGGKVYIDGANMNAMVGWASPGAFGGDVSHLNLHKTFCIPHGGGGPGVGPVCLSAELAPYLPTDLTSLTPQSVGPISGAPLGNALVLPISWMYCRMMGAEGLTKATEIAILSANYISHRLKDHYPTLYTSAEGQVAHECILDLRPLKEKSGISAEDVAKRLMDYGFHAPTLSFPVPGTLMVEPTESESLTEIDRFIEAMILIRKEIQMVMDGIWPTNDNPLVNAPHTASHICADAWSHPYTRNQAALPTANLKLQKYWPPVSRIDNVYGDRNLFCSCSD